MIQIQTNFPLSSQTFYGIGGAADRFIECDSGAEFAEIWAETASAKTPKIIFGSGANVAFADAGFRGSVFRFLGQKIEFFEKNTQPFVRVESGRNFDDFLETSAKKKFANLQNLAGIPGTVGGFVRGNAGAFGAETADFLVEISVVDALGRILTFSPKMAEFEYRGSFFKKNPDFVVLSAVFRLEKSKETPEKILENLKTLRQQRWQKYPPGRSLGSVFKNPPAQISLKTRKLKTQNNRFFAGEILELLGAKSDQIGNIQISQKHANFFLNLGNGSQRDLIALVAKWQSAARDHFGVELEPEIQILDEFGKLVSW